MAEVFTVKVEGGAQLQKTLEELPVKLAHRTTRKYLKAGAEFIRQEVMAQAPSQTGFLASHFQVRIYTSRDEIGGTALVRPRHVDYPRRGHKLHNIARNFLKGRGPDIGTTIDVPSVARFLEFGTRKMSAHPFLSTAFEASKDGALIKVVEGIKIEIERLEHRGAI